MNPMPRQFWLASMMTALCAACTGNAGGLPTVADGGAATSGGVVGASLGGANQGGASQVGAAAGDSGVQAGGNSNHGGAAGSATAGNGAMGGTTTASGGTSVGGAYTGGGANGGGTVAAVASGPLAPADGALLGAFVGTGTVDQLEKTLGRRFAIVHDFFGWTDDWVARVATDLNGGRIPLITWEAWNGGVGVSLDEISNGAHDTLIRNRATAAKNVGQKFFLRWGHEMNGNWYPWDGSHNGANAAATAKYISAYRHIHDLFTSAGASNVIWVFCPNVDSVPGEAWNQWLNYYPGDAYVDWMAFDGYNWGTVQAGGSWQTFTSMAGRIYAGLAAKNKPIMIPETASTELGGDKAAWIAGVLPALEASYPNIRAFVWFHMDKETDWRLDSSTAARASSLALANDPYLNPVALP